jgi:hypothetical protein
LPRTVLWPWRLPYSPSRPLPFPRVLGSRLHT